jgi:hypothetical protein
LLRKNTAGQHLPFSLLDVGSGSLKTGVSVSGWVGKDGGALVTVGGAITSTGQGSYVCSLTQADTSANALYYMFTGASCVAVGFTVYPVGYDPTSSTVPASVAVIPEVTVATSGLRNTSLTLAAYASIAGAGWTYPVSTANVSGSFGAKYQPLLRAEILSATANTVVVSTNATAVSDFYKTGLAYIVDGSGSGQPGRLIAAYESSGTTRRFTLQTALAIVPNTGAFLELIDGIGYAPDAVTFTGEVSIATSGIRANSFQTAALTSIAGANWGYTTRLLSADVTVGAMAVHVTVATSGIGNTALTAAAYTSVGTAVWAAGTRVLTAPVTIASMGGVEVTIATSGLRNTGLTAAAYASIGAAVAAGSAPSETSIATIVWQNATRLLSADVTVGTMNTEVSVAHAVDVESFNGDTASVIKLARSAKDIGQGSTGAASTVVSIVVASCSPSLFVADQFKGCILKFNEDTATSALRGQTTDIVSNTTSLLVVTSLTHAPASGDNWMIH